MESNTTESGQEIKGDLDWKVSTGFHAKEAICDLGKSSVYGVVCQAAFGLRDEWKVRN